MIQPDPVRRRARARAAASAFAPEIAALLFFYALVILTDTLDLVCQQAPKAPPSLRRVVAVMLTNPQTTPDALLIVADAIREASFFVVGNPWSSADMRELADIIADQAAARARGLPP